jgi:hypothetical protein
VYDRGDSGAPGKREKNDGENVLRGERDNLTYAEWM